MVIYGDMHWCTALRNEKPSLKRTCSHIFLLTVSYGLRHVMSVSTSHIIFPYSLLYSVLHHQYIRWCTCEVTYVLYIFKDQGNILRDRAFRLCTFGYCSRDFHTARTDRNMYTATSYYMYILLKSRKPDAASDYISSSNMKLKRIGDRCQFI